MAPVNLTLGSPSASALVVSWAVVGGGAESFVVDVGDAASGAAVGHTVLPGDARSHILRSLSPGTRYSVAVRATAGPFHASSPNLTHCTRECDALLAPRCSSHHISPFQFSQRPHWGSCLAYLCHPCKYPVLILCWMQHEESVPVPHPIPGSHPHSLRQQPGRKQLPQSHIQPVGPCC